MAWLDANTIAEELEGLLKLMGVPIDDLDRTIIGLRLPSSYGDRKYHSQQDIANLKGYSQPAISSRELLIRRALRNARVQMLAGRSGKTRVRESYREAEESLQKLGKAIGAA